jgi:hypothetical protein
MPDPGGGEIDILEVRQVGLVFRGRGRIVLIEKAQGAPAAPQFFGQFQRPLIALEKIDGCSPVRLDGVLRLCAATFLKDACRRVHYWTADVKSFRFCFAVN